MDNEKAKKHFNKVFILGLIFTPIGFLLRTGTNKDISSLGNILFLVGVTFIIYGMFKFLKADNISGVETQRDHGTKGQEEIGNIKIDKKTLTYLYSKGRNRFAKVVFIFFYALIIFFVYFSSIGEPGRVPRGTDDYIEFIITITIITLIFELIRRAFYYIALGVVKPKK